MFGRRRKQHRQEKRQRDKQQRDKQLDNKLAKHPAQQQKHCPAFCIRFLAGPWDGQELWTREQVPPRLMVYSVRYGEGWHHEYLVCPRPDYLRAVYVGVSRGAGPAGNIELNATPD